MRDRKKKNLNNRSRSKLQFGLNKSNINSSRSKIVLTDSDDSGTDGSYYRPDFSSETSSSLDTTLVQQISNDS